mgnify:CR=1 FL=1
MTLRQQVAALAEHYRAAEIARRLGCSRQRVHQILATLGIEAQPKPPPPPKPPRVKLTKERRGDGAILYLARYGSASGPLVSAGQDYYLRTDDALLPLATAEVEAEMMRLERKAETARRNGQKGRRPNLVDWSLYPPGCGSVREVAARAGVSVSGVRKAWKRA